MILTPLSAIAISGIAAACSLAVVFRGWKRAGNVGEIISVESTLPQTQKSGVTAMFCLLWLAIVVGMLTIAVYRSIRLGVAFRAESLILAAILSPLVVRATLGGRGEILRLPWYRICLNGYQAGFFWQTLIGEALPGR